MKNKTQAVIREEDAVRECAERYAREMQFCFPVFEGEPSSYFSFWPFGQLIIQDAAEGVWRLISEEDRQAGLTHDSFIVGLETFGQLLSNGIHIFGIGDDVQWFTENQTHYARVEATVYLSRAEYVGGVYYPPLILKGKLVLKNEKDEWHVVLRRSNFEEESNT